MRVLFVSLTDDLGSDRLVSDMGRAGARCAVLGPADCVAALPRSVDSHFTVPSGLRAAFALARNLDRAATTWKPDRVVPLDDLAATLLRTIALNARTSAPMRRLLEDSFGQPAGYAAACERVGLMETARAIGVRTPPFQSADALISRPSADAIALPAMVKRDQSSGSGGVVRVATRRALASAVRRGWLKSALKAQAARLAGLGRRITPVLIQGVVEGRLAMFTAVCRDGTMIDGVGFTAVESHPVKRSSTILRHAPEAELAEAARRIVAALGCSGFVSFDFILDAEGHAFLIEMNPRPIGSAHLGRRFGHDLAQAYLTGTASGGEAVSDAGCDVALFPKELERDPTGRRLEQGGTVHDIPAHEPLVVAAYLKRLQAEHPAHAMSLAQRCGAATAASPVLHPLSAHPTTC